MALNLCGTCIVRVMHVGINTGIVEQRWVSIEVKAQTELISSFNCGYPYDCHRHIYLLS